MAARNCNPSMSGKLKSSIRAIWPGRVVEGQALCTGYSLDAGISGSRVPAEEAATHRAIPGTVVDNQDGQGERCCHTAFFRR